MGHVALSAGGRIALVMGLAMSMMAPNAIRADALSCPSPTITAPSEAVGGVAFTVTVAGVPAFASLSIVLSSDTSATSRTLGVVTANIQTVAVTSVTAPTDFPPGPAHLGVWDDDTDCNWSRPIEITQLVFNPGAGLTTTTTTSITSTTTSPTTTTTTTTPTTTTTAAVTTTTTASSTSTTTGSVSSSTSEAVTSQTVASSSTTQAPGTTLVAGASAAGDGGTPWAAWITGGIIGVLIGAAMMLAAVRKEIIKV